MLKWYIFAIIVVFGGSTVLGEESPVLIDSQDQLEPELPIENSNDTPIANSDDAKVDDETNTEDLNGAELRWGWGGRGYGGWGGWGGGWSGRGYDGGWRWGGGWGGLGGWGYGKGWGGYRKYWG